jgi:hypothetical protein
VTIRIELSRRKMALGKQENGGFKCSPLKHHCTYLGGVMYWELKDCPVAAIYRGTIFLDELVYRTPMEREISDATRLHPQSGKGGCGLLVKALSDTCFPGNCKILCDGEPKAAVIDSFCKGAVAELETSYRLNFIQGTLTQDKSRQNKTFKEHCILQFRLLQD